MSMQTHREEAQRSEPNTISCWQRLVTPLRSSSPVVFPARHSVRWHLCKPVSTCTRATQQQISLNTRWKALNITQVKSSSTLTSLRILYTFLGLGILHLTCRCGCLSPQTRGYSLSWHGGEPEETSGGWGGGCDAFFDGSPVPFFLLSPGNTPPAPHSSSDAFVPGLTHLFGNAPRNGQPSEPRRGEVTRWI